MHAVRGERDHDIRFAFKRNFPPLSHELETLYLFKKQETKKSVV
jgi:hypothetical protein